MQSYEKAISHLNEILSILYTVKSDQMVIKSLCVALYDVSIAINETNTEILISNTNNNVLDEVCQAKGFNLTKNTINLIIKIYSCMLKKNIPGYFVRNTLTSMINTLNNKQSNSSAKECAVLLIDLLFKYRSNDCGNLINDYLLISYKLIKSTDYVIKSNVLQSINSLLNNSQYKLQDIHNDIFKNIVNKLITDKNIDIRILISQIIESLIIYSSGCSTIPLDVFIQLCNKYIDDENIIIQENYCKLVATIYIEKINFYNEKVKNSKIGLNRGLDIPSSPAQLTKKLSISQRISNKLNITSSSNNNNNVEEFTYKSILQLILKNIIKNNNRYSYLIVLKHLIYEYITTDEFDLNWLTTSLIQLLRDPIIVNLPFNDIIYIKIKLSYLIRYIIIYLLNENKQIEIVNHIISYISSIELKNEYELQLCFDVLNNCIVICNYLLDHLIDDIYINLSIYLQHVNFNVRVSTAYVISNLAIYLPENCHGYLTNALSNANKEIILLLKNSLTTNTKENALLVSNNLKESDLLVHMFNLHGNILILCYILTNVNKTSNNISSQLLVDILDFGVICLSQDIANISSTYRNIICSIIRAGSLIITSTFYYSYHIIIDKLLNILTLCQVTVANAMNNQSNQSDDDLLYECMIIEANLIIISNISIYIPKFLLYNNNHVSIVINILNSILHIIKYKYQVKLKFNYRFICLTILLYETYLYLPVHLLKHYSNHIYIDSLRYFRDCLTNNSYVSSNHLLYHFIQSSNYASLFNKYASSYTGKYISTYLEKNEFILINKIDRYINILQKKENENYLNIISKDIININITNTITDNQSIYDSNYSSIFLFNIQTISIDSRSIDVCILVLSQLFNYQTIEYQTKTIQLLSYAIIQYLKNYKEITNNNLNVIKNILLCLLYVVNKVIFVDSNFNQMITNIQVIVDRCIDILNNNLTNEIKLISSYILVQLLSKLSNYVSRDINSNVTYDLILENIFIKLSNSINSGFDKKNDSMADYSCYVLLLGCLWCNSSVDSQINSYGSHSQNVKPTSLKDRIITLFLDCLRRIDTSVLFRGHAIIGITDIISYINNDIMSQISSNTTIKTRVDSLLDSYIANLVNLTTVIDIHLSNYQVNLDSNNQLEIYILNYLLNLLPLSLYISTYFHYRNDYKDLTVQSVRLFYSIIASSIDVIEIKSLVIEIIARIINYLYVNKFNVLSFDIIIELWNEILINMRNYSIDILTNVVLGIKQLILLDSQLVCQNKLEIKLFIILDWLLGSKPSTVTISLSGVELKSIYLPETVNDSKNDLITLVKDTILLLIQTDISVYPKERISYWILFTRNLTLNIRVLDINMADNTDNRIDNDVDRTEDNEIDNEPANILDNDAESKVDKLNISQYITKYRDSVLYNMVDIPATRLSMKLIAITYTNEIINYLYNYLTLHPEESAYFIDLSTAKRNLSNYLAGHAIDKELLYTPNYLQSGSSVYPTYYPSNKQSSNQSSHPYNSPFTNTSNDKSNETSSKPSNYPLISPIFYLHDVINYACAVNSYTINDKTISSLQEHSMNILLLIMKVWSFTSDSESANQSNYLSIYLSNNQTINHSNSLILSQYITQYISSIRLSITTIHNTNLYININSLLVHLLINKYLTDGSVIKKLIKNYIVILIYYRLIYQINLQNLSAIFVMQKVIYQII